MAFTEPRSHAAPSSAIYSGWPNQMTNESYCPGELLLKWAALPSMELQSEHDGVSECSTKDRLISWCTSSASSDLDSDQDHIPLTGESIGLPSVGSAGHYCGTCSPCGFFYHKNGCMDGASCKFCHVCPPGTIERQRKLKLLKRKQLRAGVSVQRTIDNIASVARFSEPIQNS